MRTAWWDKIHIGPESEAPPKKPSKLPARRALAAIGLGGFIAGGFDLTYAVTFYAVRGGKPIRIPQAIASGLLGMDSYNGGWGTASLGIALHFFIALSAAGLYYLASRKLKFLVSWAGICGVLYGAAIFFFMRRVVLPLSAAPPFKPGWLAFSTDLAVHLFLIGLPIALCLRHFSKPLSR
jgi:hypothetical protein